MKVVAKFALVDLVEVNFVILGVVDVGRFDLAVGEGPWQVQAIMRWTAAEKLSCGWLNPVIINQKIWRKMCYYVLWRRGKREIVVVMKNWNTEMWSGKQLLMVFTQQMAGGVVDLQSNQLY